jgi:hypothetical protein
LVFIDETWVKTNREPLRGWGPRQQRLPARIPHGHGKTLTFVAALRHDRIDAPWVIDGPINGELFSVYVDKVLAPTVAQGEIVVLDNLGGHKGKPARAAIGAAGALRHTHIFSVSRFVRFAIHSVCRDESWEDGAMQGMMDFGRFGDERLKKGGSIFWPPSWANGPRACASLAATGRGRSAFDVFCIMTA